MSKTEKILEKLSGWNQIAKGMTRVVKDSKGKIKYIKKRIPDLDPELLRLKKTQLKNVIENK